MTKKLTSKHIKTIASALLVSALVLCTMWIFWHKENTKPNTVLGAILPHHLLVDYEIEKLYTYIASRDPDIRTIILISPNHFNYGQRYVQSTDIDLPALDVDKIHTLNTAGAFTIEPKYYSKEHGITVHIPYIQKHFPNAKIIPIIIKQTTPEEKLDTLIKALKTILDDHTLMIASIDFTHYVSEKYALPQDERTENWLLKESLTAAPKTTFDTLKGIAKTLDPDSADGVSMDSPESLYTITQLLQNKNLSAIFHKRTSSNSLLHSAKGADNTSHLFFTFEK